MHLTPHLLAPGYYYAYKTLGSDGQIYVIKVLKQEMNQTMNDDAFLEMLMNEFLIDKYYREQFTHFSDAGRIATFYDFEPFNDLDPTQITLEWTKNNLTSGMHVVEFVPNEYPINQECADTKELSQ